jgi:hypothetical protein
MPDRVCAHNGCTQPYYGDDSCKSHYMKAYRKARSETRILKGRPINEDRAEMIWRGIVLELGIAGSNQRGQAI